MWLECVLYAFCEHHDGLRFSVDVTTGSEEKLTELTVLCQLPTLCRIVAFYPRYDSVRHCWVQADGFLGEFLHPSGVVIEIPFVYHHCMRIEGDRDAVYNNLELTGIPAYSTSLQSMANTDTFTCANLASHAHTRATGYNAHLGC